jgi:hypothetical protein
MLRALLAFLLAAGAPLVLADTYKWVDEKGVVNYSNAPPPASARGAAAQTVPDRISSYSTDPVVASQSNEVSRRLDANQQEWLQRQYLMAMQATYAPAPATDYSMPGYYYPAYGVVHARRVANRPAFFTPVKSTARPMQRASLRRF